MVGLNLLPGISKLPQDYMPDEYGCKDRDPEMSSGLHFVDSGRHTYPCHAESCRSLDSLKRERGHHFSSLSVLR